MKLKAWRNRLTTTALLALAGIGPAWACSIATDVIGFQPAARGTKEREVSPPWMPVPQPTVRVASVKHPESSVSGRCSAYTWVVMEVSVPLGAEFAAKDLGFVFRSPVPQDPFLSFPCFPITSKAISDDGATLRFTFGFEGRDKAVPIEVFAMNKALQVGPSTTVVIELPDADEEADVRRTLDEITPAVAPRLLLQMQGDRPTTPPSLRERKGRPERRAPREASASTAASGR